MIAKILIIDDSESERKYLTALLTGMEKLEIYCAVSGSQGMKMIQTCLPDLILLDQVLPDVSGREILRWLKGQKTLQATPVIMLTTEREVDKIVTSLSAGANDYITKPFHDMELKARVTTVLRERKLKESLAQKNAEYEMLVQKFERLAITDPVTGIYNRRRFDQALKNEFDRYKRYGTPFSCLLIDVDDFKQINDRLGHEMGDKVLNQVVRAIQSPLREVDILARYGGDEFAVLLIQQQSKDIQSVAARILQSVSGSSCDEVLKAGLIVTISMGIASVQSAESDTAQKFIRRADDALYRAKRRGKNCIELSLCG